MVDKDIEHCLAVLKEECINERQSLFDFKLISTLEKCKTLEAENEDLQNNFDEATSIICRLEAENKALKDILKKAYKGFSDDNPDLAFELLDDNRDLIL